MLKRFLTSIVIMAITVGFFALRYVSPYLFDIYVGAIAICATYEVCRVFEKNNKKLDKYFVLAYPILIYAMLMIAIHCDLGELLYFALIILLALVITLACYVKNLINRKKLNKEMVDLHFDGTLKRYVSNKILRDIFVLIYPAFLLSLMFFVNHIAEFGYFGGNGDIQIGMLLLVMIFATTMATDTGAYLIGCGIRGKKLCPKISPNKTISGAIGGIICSIVISLVLYIIFGSIDAYLSLFATYNISIWTFLIYGVLASIISQMGDIYASLIKRQNGVKDYGNILPGHGGFMDRVDGISFNLVLTVIFAFFMFL
jgi:CDP-diglyceride synthetase